MSRSLRIARLFDIDIRIHVTFFLLPIIVGGFYFHQYGFLVGLRAFFLIPALFVCVLGHELCHSLVAKRFAVRVPEITLYFIGGVASMHRIPRQPKKEFLIAVVGPLFNFALAAAVYFPLYFWLGPENLYRPSLDSWPGTLANLFWINPLLGLFNLVPAFPMDGGRMLRSGLAFRMDYLKATRISVYLGHGFAILFLLLGLWERHWMLVFIAFFVYAGASDELRMVTRSYPVDKTPH